MEDYNVILNEFEQWCDSMNEDCPVICLDVLKLLKDRGKIVTCKDCRHADISSSGLIKCQGRFRCATWFCADGEMK